MSAAVAPERLRIGEVARRLGTTPRTIRYYEEIGLLPGGEREAGRHRLYGEDEVARLHDALRLKRLLGLSLEELGELMEAEEARAARRDEWRHGNPSERRRRQILEAGLGHVDRQLELLQRRSDALEGLRAELTERRDRVAQMLREL